jgi:hypothetical protein
VSLKTFSCAASFRSFFLSSEAIDGRRRDLQMNEGNSRNHGCTFGSALGYRLMQLAAKRMGNEYIDLAQRPFLYFFGDWLHSVSAR